ncbi:hypothetical protein K9L97_02475 [Candidatus Woesearchaeota archaeon]|nr:hypothetical protein [Candidatus Woesearchaeota archaeon]
MNSIELVSTEDVLNTVRLHGPLIPLEVRKILRKGDSITIGAALSQLVASKNVLFTNVKRGGSPFYYMNGQEAKLERAADNLNEKDKQTFNYLKSEKVLRDKKQEPLTRVSLRQIKDFSREFSVTVNGEKEIFWRYYLVSEQEAYNILKERYAPRKEEVKVPEKVKDLDNQDLSAVAKGSVESEVKVEKQEKKFSSPKSNSFIEKNKEEQKKLSEVDSKTVENIFDSVTDEFLTQIKRFFDKNNIFVVNAELVRKGSEYNFTILMETPMGRAEYFCKAKSKKKSNDGDLSTAYVQGQAKRIPVVYLTTGEVTKKAKDKLKTDYKGMLIKEI